MDKKITALVCVLFLMLPAVGCKNTTSDSTPGFIELLLNSKQDPIGRGYFRYLAKDLETGKWVYIRIGTDKYKVGDKLEIEGEWLGYSWTEKAFYNGEFNYQVPVMEVRHAKKHIQVEKEDLRNIKKKEESK